MKIRLLKHARDAALALGMALLALTPIGAVNAQQAVNTATVTAPVTTTDPTPGNNSATDSDDVVRLADLSLTKTASPDPVDSGSVLTYTLTVSNAGPSAILASDTFSIEESLPAELAACSFTPSAGTFLPGTIVPGSTGTGTWTGLTLNSGGSATLDIACTVTSTTGGPITNTATVIPPTGVDDPDCSGAPVTCAGNNTGSVTSVVTAVADVSVTKTITTPGPYVAGQTVSYDIVVANNGPSTAINVLVSDTPTNVTITSVSGACVAFPCTIPSIVSGGSATITVTGTIGAGGGAFNNSATAVSPTVDPNPGNNTDDDPQTAGASADLTLSKTITTAGPYTAGQTVSYDIVVSNGGPSTATGVIVTDTPTNITITTVSGAGCTTFPCNIGDLVSGASATITVTGTIGAGGGAFNNSATATSPVTDPNPGDNTDDDPQTAGATADLSVVKTLTTAGPYVVGQTISFDIVVSNAGPSPATNVAVTDASTNLTIVTVTGACTALPCTIANIASGASATVTVTATIDSDGPFSNSATATPVEPDPDPANNTGSASASTTPTADVSVVKTLVTTGPFYTGQSVDYQIVVSNAGPSTASNVVVTDTPTNLSITSVSGGGCTAFPCTIASIAAGASVTINVTATIGAQAGTFSNNATVAADEADPVAANNSSAISAIALPNAVLLKVTKTAAPHDVQIGDLVRYTVRIDNIGDTDAIDVILVDTPPAGFNYVDNSLSVADADGAGRLVGTYPIQVDQIDIRAGESATVVYLLRVGAGVRGGIHVNHAHMEAAGITVSNEATAQVQLRADPMLDESLILGTVFDDRNGNGHQDDGERGIPGVRIASVEGLLMETDQFGRYHLVGIEGGPWERGRNFILKIDTATLPPGSRFTTANPLVRRITPGIPVRFDFGVELPPVEDSQPSVQIALPSTDGSPDAIPPDAPPRDGTQPEGQ